jgi:hypothetical protein
MRHGSRNRAWLIDLESMESGPVFEAFLDDDGFLELEHQRFHWGGARGGGVTRVADSLMAGAAPATLEPADLDFTVPGDDAVVAAQSVMMAFFDGSPKCPSQRLRPEALRYLECAQTAPSEKWDQVTDWLDDAAGHMQRFVGAGHFGELRSDATQKWINGYLKIRSGLSGAIDWMADNYVAPVPHTYLQPERLKHLIGTDPRAYYLVGSLPPQELLGIFSNAIPYHLYRHNAEMLFFGQKGEFEHYVMVASDGNKSLVFALVLELSEDMSKSEIDGVWWPMQTLGSRPGLDVNLAGVGLGMDLSWLESAGVVPVDQLLPTSRPSDTPPPGWYPDPEGLSDFLRWDGTQWTADRE